MKKTIFVLLSVMILALAGCGDKKSNVGEDTSTTKTVTDTTEDSTKKHPEETEPVTEVTTESVTEESTTEESDKDASKQEDSNSNDKNDSQDTKPAKDTQPTQVTQPVSEPQQTTPAEPEQPQQAARVEYSPANVVALATAKTKAAGKVLLTENLDSMLANGQISQQEYNEYYPYDGAGYYSVFVDSNMAEARSVSGTTQFNSEDDIAQFSTKLRAFTTPDRKQMYLL